MGWGEKDKSNRPQDGLFRCFSPDLVLQSVSLAARGDETFIEKTV